MRLAGSKPPRVINKFLRYGSKKGRPKDWKRIEQVVIVTNQKLVTPFFLSFI